MFHVGLPSPKLFLLNPSSNNQNAWADVFRKGSIYTKRRAVKVKFPDYLRLLDSLFVQGYFVYRL
jgi:hypothetical protein